MSIPIIRSELETKLKAWADSKNIPVSFQNVSFSKPSNGSQFVECFLIPNNNLQLDVSMKRTTMIGLFQVNCWSKVGTGMGAVESLADGVINAFRPLPKSGLVSIEGKPYSRPSILDGSGYVIVPVLIKYRFEST